MQRYMEKLKSVTRKLISITYLLLRGIKLETQKIGPLILNAGPWGMHKKLFNAIEAMLKATIYLQVLWMGATITTLGLAITTVLAWRIWQFIWVLILGQKWL
jgi:hypothetical protein